MFRFFKRMIAFRKAHPSLTRSRFWRENVRWYGVGHDTDLAYDSRGFAFALHGGSQQDIDIYVMINAYLEELTFQIQEGATNAWRRVVDTSLESPFDFLEPGNESPLKSLHYRVPGRRYVGPRQGRGVTAMKVNPLAGKPAPPAMLANIPRLVTAYYTDMPDFSVPTQRVAFGTSGHRGSSFEKTFNEGHVLAISQAICLYRKQQGIDGPLFLGIDTHALSMPAFASALEVLAANGVEVMLAENDEYTPTPAVSHAILAYNRGRDKGLADGIVITPSHNPPDNGGFKYNPPNGGPADSGVTGWIEAKANEFLKDGLQGVKRRPFEKALRAATTHRHDYLNAYVSDLGKVIDMDAICGANIGMGVDPHWSALARAALFCPG